MNRNPVIHAITVLLLLCPAGALRAQTAAIVDPKLAGNADQFVTSSIPIGVPSGADTSSFNLHVRQTRFNVDFRRPTRKGPLRVFLEADFFGSDGPTGFRMRHAYGQARNLLVGWTWSTLVDVDAFPDTLDNMTTNGASKTRQPQVRYTVPLKGGASASASRFQFSLKYDLIFWGK